MPRWGSALLEPISEVDAGGGIGVDGGASKQLSASFLRVRYVVSAF